ncbi:hypothetical protein RM190_08570 [Paracoccus sp. CPCC 101403]|uniref:Uncharacterized protein n=1 Tax=Paracoccus broussonetiae TaxID=3075834 RepID=A0ABU3ECF5_9RHOB|nr:hypothetical protein [Paracoccus sp. CPCC 101403]MDT1061907.1 hypothetical protein [Paracoccus sp. CPCC 101403]
MDLIRNTPAALLSAISGPYFFPVVLFYLDWPGAPLRAHSNLGDITWGVQTWTGVGKFGRLEMPEETFGGVPTEFTATLVSDFPELETYSNTAIKGAVCRAYLGAVTERGGNTLLGAVEIAAGIADAMGMSPEEVELEDGATTLMYGLRVTMTTGPSYRTMAAIAHSHEDQLRNYPGDTAGRHLILAQAEAQKTLWPEP